ncbi:endonuclease V [Candidatus Uabimicrobium amorphum]|uniref:Endonuclease V n=1 Tax=Uabimicrobium amorphum TaxID=2596890 RepID=A0A5S9IID9_UABAM|nr:endonuclease V [Candidatus Uabimicrobium amorphum]BBM82224.1 endonuclease V [Candidatus Uabimicrobium amorphum]
MDTSSIHSGHDFLTTYLQKNSFSFHSLTVESFRSFLEKILEREKNNDIFQQRAKIRDLKKNNWQQYSSLQKQLKIAEQEFDKHPNKPLLQEIENGIDSSQKAINGLSGFLEKNPQDEKRREKLENFQKKLQDLQAQQSEMVAKTPEKVNFENAKQALYEFEVSLHLPEEEEKLAGLLKKQGQKRSFAGSQFEDVSLPVVQENLCPILYKRYDLQPSDVTILSNITLGCARAEIDYLVIQEIPEKPVKVLAIIEVKKNINDIAAGFELRQENIHWFTGNSDKYDAQIYRTKVFKDGHFSRAVTHSEHGKEFLFDRSSFEHFECSGEHFLRDLFFITYQKNLVGLRASEKSVLSHRMSTDVFFNLDDEKFVVNLFSWCLERFSPLQTKSVLELYLQEHAQNIFIVENIKKNDNEIREHLEKEQEKLLPLVSIPEKDGYTAKDGDVVFAFDIQYKGDEAHVAVDVFRWPQEHIKTYAGLFRINVPYVPSYFCFREGPPLLAIYQKVVQDENIQPQLLIIDGHGIAHPRKFGVACWLGVATQIPALGCAKETLIPYDGDQLKSDARSTVPMTYNDESLGFAVRRFADVNPVYVSPGHLISQQQALEICCSLAGEFKIPDTIRRADQAARQHCAGQPGEWTELGLLPKAIPLWEK